MTTCMEQIVARHFNASTRKALVKAGIVFHGLTTIPGDGPMPWANGETGYQVAHNGMGRILSHKDLRAIAGKK